MFSSRDKMLPYHPRPVVVDRRWKPNVELAPNCPRCDSSNTKFCYYNNYSLAQPRYFCKGCRRYWTKGGSLRNVPVGGGCRKNRRGKSVRMSGGGGHVFTGGRDLNCRRDAPGSIRPDLALDDMVGRSSCQSSGGSGSISSIDVSNSDGSTIDLGLLYAKFLNRCPELDGQGIVVPELPGDVGGPISLLDHQMPIQMPETLMSTGSECSSLGDQLINFPNDPIAYDSALFPLDEVFDDFLTSNCSVVPSLMRQQPPPPKYHDFDLVIAAADATNQHQNPVIVDWSAFDQSSFEALHSIGLY